MTKDVSEMIGLAQAWALTRQLSHLIQRFEVKQVAVDETTMCLIECYIETSPATAAQLSWDFAAYISDNNVEMPNLVCSFIGIVW